MLNKIKDLIDRALPMPADFDILVPPDENLGDYSTNVAFVLGKMLKRAPFEIAREVVAKIKIKDRGNLFSKIDIANPGFINFWLSDKALKLEFIKIFGPSVGKSNRNKYGAGSLKKQKIQVEFLSANPTGPLTLANGRGGFYGDVLSNILKFYGYKTQKEYYINDAGNQIRLLGESILARLKIINLREEHYQGNYIGELALKIKEKIQKFILSEEPINHAEMVGQVAAESLLKEIKASVGLAGIKYDNWFSETDKLRRSGLLDKILSTLKSRNLLIEKNGAVSLKAPNMPPEETVLVKSSKEPTYLLADLAYHYNKFVQRKFDLVIDIWGADHHGYAKKLKEALAVFGMDVQKLVIIITQLVRLVEEGKEVRMSKRKGEFITFDEVIEKVGVSAARFIFLLYSLDTHMDFDWGLAQKKSLENPVYYFQYSYVRANKILRKAGSRLNIRNLKFGLLSSREELALIKELIKFPDIIEDISKTYKVHLLPQYVLRLAKTFHVFYESKNVLNAEVAVRASRLLLVAAVVSILKTAADLLGVELPEEM